MGERPESKTAANVIREAIEDGALTHTGRSLGDVASQRIAEEILTALAPWLSDDKGVPATETPVDADDCPMCHRSGWVVDSTPTDDPISLALLPCLLPDCEWSGRPVGDLEIPAVLGGSIPARSVPAWVDEGGVRDDAIHAASAAAWNWVNHTDRPWTLLRDAMASALEPFLSDDGAPATMEQAGWIQEGNGTLYELDPAPENHADDVANSRLRPLYRFRPSAVPKTKEADNG